MSKLDDILEDHSDRIMYGSDRIKSDVINLFEEMIEEVCVNGAYDVIPDLLRKVREL